MVSCADVNTEIENLKQAVVKQLKAGQPVFFGCDVGQFSDRNAGVMDTALFEYEVRIPTLPQLCGVSLISSPFSRRRSTSSSG